MLVELGACNGGLAEFDRKFPSGKGELEAVQNATSGLNCEWLDDRKSRIAAMQNEQPKEPIKLYCVKDYTSFLGSHWLTKGKTYEFNGYGVTFNNGFCSSGKRTFDEWSRSNPNISACLIRAEKRPAKVGEYVMVENEADPIQVSRFCGVRDDCVVLADGRHTKVLCREINYEVLDGYTPEPEKEPEPVGWNGKVVCTKSKVDFLTTGKVYTFKNGLSVDDVGDPLPFSKTLIKNAGELQCRSFGDFVPCLGEA